MRWPHAGGSKQGRRADGHDPDDGRHQGDQAGGGVGVPCPVVAQQPAVAMGGQQRERRSVRGPTPDGDLDGQLGPRGDHQLRGGARPLPRRDGRRRVGDQRRSVSQPEQPRPPRLDRLRLGGLRCRRPAGPRRGATAAQDRSTPVPRAQKLGVVRARAAQLVRQRLGHPRRIGRRRAPPAGGGISPHRSPAPLRRPLPP